MFPVAALLLLLLLLPPLLLYFDASFLVSASRAQHSKGAEIDVLVAACCDCHCVKPSDGIHGNTL
jgi:cytochrome c553